jgi:hypothetical protein
MKKRNLPLKPSRGKRLLSTLTTSPRFFDKVIKVRLVHGDTAPRTDHHQEFVDILNEMRFGALSSKSIQSIKRLSRPIEYEDGLAPIEL